MKRYRNLVRLEIVLMQVYANPSFIVCPILRT